MKTKLSVCIVAYHNYKDIIEAIHRLEKYTSREIGKKVYIVDNSIPSEKQKSEFELFRKELSQYDDVSIISVGENLGFGKGHNYIIENIDSEYHAIVNPDILFFQDAFKPILSYMDDNKDIGMCIPKIVDEKGELQHVYRKELTVLDMFVRMFCKNMFPKRVAAHTMQDMDYSKPFQVPFGQGSFLVIRTELFKKINGFDERFFMYMEDADLCKRVNAISKLMYFPKASVIHKWEQGSHKNKTLFKYHIQSMRMYFKKWGYKWW